MSLLSDVFPKERRGTITAIIAASISIGLGAAVTLGGAVADAWDAAYPNGGAPLGFSGWQAAFIVAALPGVVISFLLWRLPEPVRGAADGIVQPKDPKPFSASWNTLAAILPGFAWLNFLRQKAPAKSWAVNIGLLALIISAGFFLIQWTNGLRESNPVALSIGGIDLTGNNLQWLVSGFGVYILVCWIQSLRLSDKASHAVIIQSPSVWLAVIIAALQMVINYGVMAWTPAYIIKEFNQTAAQTGAVFGPISACIGIIGPLIAGPLSDWVHRRIESGRLYVTLVALTVSPLLALIVYNVDSVVMFYVTFCFYGLILTMWLPPIYAAYLDLVLPRMRGMMMSFYILASTITGLGLGPYSVGLISDVNGGDLGNAILCTNFVAPFLVVSIILLIRRLQKDESLILSRARAAGEPV
jgi:MFS family permease